MILEGREGNPLSYARDCARRPRLRQVFRGAAPSDALLTQRTRRSDAEAVNESLACEKTAAPAACLLAPARAVPRLGSFGRPACRSAWPIPAGAVL